MATANENILVKMHTETWNRLQCQQFFFNGYILKALHKTQ